MSLRYCGREMRLTFIIVGTTFSKGYRGRTASLFRVVLPVTSTSATDDRFLSRGQTLPHATSVWYHQSRMKVREKVRNNGFCGETRRRRNEGGRRVLGGSSEAIHPFSSSWASSGVGWLPRNMYIDNNVTRLHGSTIAMRSIQYARGSITDKGHHSAD